MYLNHLLLFLKEGDKTTVNLVKKTYIVFCRIGCITYRELRVFVSSV